MAAEDKLSDGDMYNRDLGSEGANGASIDGWKENIKKSQYNDAVSWLFETSPSI
jgi:hypothetical protein